MGQNFNEHRNEYYRDHFIHQIRDMYMMVIMLEKFGAFEAAFHVMRDSSVGKISEYTVKKWKQFYSGRGLPQRAILEEMYNNLDSESKDGSGQTLEQYNEEYFFQYIIYASAMLSALFHDMGYPVCHFLETRHRLSEYNPFVYMFTHNAVNSFDQLAAKLGDSLLFTIVSSKEIRQSLQLCDNGRYNHGSYSAIAFLLQFYENGLLYTLSPEKQCAIELAAVAIYNHTAKYDIVKYDGHNSYTQPFFRQNPVSFLLRFCDDLQEWDRRYFEISSASDLIFCHNCHTPILKSPDSRDISAGKYQCLCGKKYPRPDSFVKRKLYLVSVADSITMGLDKQAKMLTAEVNYDLYRLLLLSNINNTYAKYRAKELQELKKLISCQDFEFQTDGILKFNRIRIEYQMSANPLLIKLWILEKYLTNNTANVEYTAQSIIDHLGRNYTFPNIVIQHISFYLELLKICTNPNNYLANSEIKELYEHRKTGDHSYDAALRCLMYDCLEQYQKSIAIGNDPFVSENAKSTYEKKYTRKEKEDALYLAISLFTDQKSRCNDYSDLKLKQNPLNRDYISYFIDMLLFYIMNEENKKCQPVTGM